MEPNTLPVYDQSDNPTGCCPRFNPEGWDNQELHFQEKPFVKVRTINLMHIPINIGRVFERTMNAIENADAIDKQQFVVLSRELSLWKSEHYFAVTKNVPGQDMVTLSGTYFTKVFEGPYKKVPEWHQHVQKYIHGMGKEAEKIYFFYTTCPKCAKYYGKNYVVGFGEMV